LLSDETSSLNKGLCAAAAADGDDGGEDGGAEEECEAEFKPLVQLDEVEVQVSTCPVGTPRPPPPRAEPLAHLDMGGS
jgi:hypothetical protein